jgi:hypothetical protein
MVKHRRPGDVWGLSNFRSLTLQPFVSQVEPAVPRFVATEGFITKEDVPHLLMIAANHPDVKQVQNIDHPVFMKNWERGYADDVRNARVLDIKWSQMAETADKIGGELSVSIHDPWME